MTIRANIKIGDKYCRLTLVQEAERNRHHQRRWTCRCDCGKEVTVNQHALLANVTKSCGCWNLNRVRTTRPTRWEICGSVAIARIHRHVVMVDTTDLPTVSEYRWRIIDGYAGCSLTTDTGVRATLHLHSLLMNEPGLECDHIDGNSCNNLRSNLRIVTHRGNSQNVFRRGREFLRGSHVNSGSNIKPWKAVVSRIYLGSFTTAEEAAEVASNYRKQHMPISNEERRRTK